MIALGLDPRTGEGQGRLTMMVDARRQAADNPLVDQPSRLRRPAAASRGEAAGCPARLRRDDCGRAATSSRSAARWSSPIGCVVGSHRLTRTAQRKRALLQATFSGSTTLRGWSRFEIASAQRIRTPDRRPPDARHVFRVRLSGFGNLAVVAFLDAEERVDAVARRLRGSQGRCRPGVRYKDAGWSVPRPISHFS